MKVLQLENASVGPPITRNGVSLVPMYVHQRVGQIATGPAAPGQVASSVSTTRVVGQALVWDDVLVHASAFALAA